jgi:uncharacterized protein YcbK (DUF882 family)
MPKYLVPALILFLCPGFASGVAAPDDPGSAGADINASKQSAKNEPAKASADKKRPEKKVNKSKKKRSRKRRCRAYAKPQYKKMVRNWQKVPRIPEPRHRAGYRDLTIYSVNLGERVRVFPFLPDGTLDPDALAEIEQVFRDKDSEATHAIDPRLVKLLYKLADHFDARQITLISGFREPNGNKTEGAHGKGRAADIMIPGVKLPALAKIARRLGHVGVGYYPTSGFIHLDVRDGPSYFWADRSGPGYPGCGRQIMKSFGPRFDRRWAAESDEPVLHKNKRGELLGAIETSTDDETKDADAPPPMSAQGAGPAKYLEP